ncbi:VTT domain-containing protein [bacterium]|nr:MAG: VTT domain-containing protein [bacterium]
MDSMTNPEPKKTNLTSILALAGTLILLFVAVNFFSKEIDQVKEFIHQAGPYAFIVTVIIYGILGASPVPSEPLTAVLSGLFHPWEAMLVATLGNSLAAFVEYYLGTHLGHLTNFEEKRQKLPFHLGRFPVDSPIFLVFGRMIPAVGPKVISLTSGIYKVPLWRYLWTTLVTNLAGAALIAYGAAGIMQLFK